jgi:hypothetical protein
MIQFNCPCACCGEVAVFLLSDEAAGKEISCPSTGRVVRVVRYQPFDEAEWLACDNPCILVKCVVGLPPSYRQDPRVTTRKLRLFACSCCRVVWDLLTDPRSRHAVEIAERFVEGMADQQELASASNEAHAIHTLSTVAGYTGVTDLSWAVVELTAEAPSANAVVTSVVGFRSRVAPSPPRRPAVESKVTALIRDIFGNPFRSVTIETGWLTANVVAIAQAIYDERAFDQLPILADSLEDAGCGNTDILNHCRQPGEHARGCWLIDLVLGKT